MERLIFHVDVNSAFLSWEAARRLREGGEDSLDLRKIPAAIGGDRDKRTGVILAKSIPAKEKGVKTGEPVAMALRKCPELILARPDFRLYERSSRAFMDICREYAPVVEKYSIDECFLDMTGTGYLYPDPFQIACRIKDHIRNSLGFTVNIGIGPNKILAKMAGDLEKPDKVHSIFLEEMPRKLWPLSVGDLFSVGASTAEKLEAEGIFRIGDLAKAERHFLQARLGNKLGAQLHDYANGIDPSPVLPEREEAKGYSVSTTLEEDVRSFETGNRILLQLADSVCARMRGDRVRASCVSVSIRGNDFKNHSHQRHLEKATDVTGEVYALSKQLFRELWDGRMPLRLLGISLSCLERGETEQMSLFPDEKREREQKIDRALDAIRGRYGMKTIARAATLKSEGEVGRKYQAQLENKRKDPE